VKRRPDHPAYQLPPDVTHPDARRAAAACRACDLWKRATQTVFGAGALPADLMFVGEQPGDQEDRAGDPFVGPAGKVLQAALGAAGLDPKATYITNAVKHFKWTPRGKRRIHEKPRISEIEACQPWLLLELSLVRPRAIVCLGATAARAVLGRAVKIGESRGHPVESRLTPLVFVTTHPSSILRAPDAESREQARAAFIEDLKKVAAALK
jgi:uracil-DNA glycosylase family protein